MTAPTHRQYSICFGFITCIIIYYFGITNINYYFALPIILLTSKSGALFPDVDHVWQNVHDKTFLNKVINTLIHITGGKHRSWQTHSIDVCALYTTASIIVPKILYDKGIISEVNKEVLLLLLLGFASGWVSHLVSDMLTSAGVRLICFLKFKVKLVPRRIGRLVFNTGHEWEAFNYKVIKITNLFLGIFCIVFPLIHSGWIYSLIENWR